MKYLKEYYATQRGKLSNFNCGDWVVPAFSTLKYDANRPYQIGGEYAPAVGQTEWHFRLENTDYEDHGTEFKESQLRRATWQEIEEEKLRRDAKKYNL